MRFSQTCMVLINKFVVLVFCRLQSYRPEVVFLSTASIHRIGLSAIRTTGRIFKMMLSVLSSVAFFEDARSDQEKRLVFTW